MAWTSADLEKLEAAIATGAMTVEYADKKVTYRSLAEMKEIRADMRRELGLSSRKRRVFATFDKGTGR